MLTREITNEQTTGAGFARNLLAAHQGSTLFYQAVTRLQAIAKTVGFSPAAIRRATDALDHMMTPWGHRPVDPAWISDITEDNSAIEFSISIHAGQPEIRMMIEAQGEQPTVASQHQAALELTRRLAECPGVDLTRFWAVEQLFRSEQPQGLFGLWHSICFTNDGDPTYKAYFNPLIEGMGNAWVKIKSAMATLGLSSSLTAVEQSVRSDELDVPKYLALDLTEGPAARVKVYLFHRHATPDYLEHVMSRGHNYIPSHGRDFTLAMSNSRVMRQRPAVTCFGYRGGSSEPELNLYVPVCAYAQDDAKIRDRVVDYMQANHFDQTAYEGALNTLAQRPLGTGLGIHSYVSSSHRKGQMRMTIYLSPELRHAFEPGYYLGSTLGSREYRYQS